MIVVKDDPRANMHAENQYDPITRVHIDKKTGLKKPFWVGCLDPGRPFDHQMILDPRCTYCCERMTKDIASDNPEMRRTVKIDGVSYTPEEYWNMVMARKARN